ncbi:MAG: hypothetical protein LQ338_007423 [Usnochroma carphineum]|nr:MAG: hypothetical protein LQ338_007423 [Usnochroma carphineum]
MSDAQARLNQVEDISSSNEAATTIPFDPNCTKFPSRNDVPRRADAPPEAAWVWGEDDQLGRINLLTPTRVKAAAAQIRTGEKISLK